MAPRSLAAIARSVCIRHIGSLDNVGDLLFSQVASILQAIKSAKQLRQIELNSPQIQGETEALWRKLIETKFRKLAAKRNYRPEDPKDWYRVYKKYERENQADIDAATAKLHESMAAINAEKAARTTTLISIEDAKRLDAGRHRHRGVKTPYSDSLTFTGGSRTKVTDGASAIRKIKRETIEHGNRMRLRTPTGATVVRPNQIKKAPAAMVNEHRIKQQAPIRQGPSTARPKPAAGPSVDESRLLAIKRADGRAPGPATADDRKRKREDEAGDSVVKRMRPAGSGILGKALPKLSSPFKARPSPVVMTPTKSEATPTSSLAKTPVKASATPAVTPHLSAAKKTTTPVVQASPSPAKSSPAVTPSKPASTDRLYTAQPIQRPTVFRRAAPKVLIQRPRTTGLQNSSRKP